MAVPNHAELFSKLNAPTQLFIDNEYVESSNKSTFDVVDPSTEEVLCKVSAAQADDIDRAVKSSRACFESGWSTKDPLERATLLFKLAELIERDRLILGAIEAVNNGKAEASASGYDIAQSARILRYYAGWVDKLPLGEIIPSDSSHTLVVRRQPIGVVGAIVPWNYPFMLTIWKLAPALAVGCTVVLKPSEQTPLSALYLGKLIKEAGFPAGAVNMVPGLGAVAGAAITAHMDIDKVSFTGSTVTGRRVMAAAAASNLKKVSLELGGKSPNVVFDDCDFDAAVEGATQALFENMGQNCCSGSRLYVQETIYDKFVAALVKKVEMIHVGDPFDPATTAAAAEGRLVHGPLIDHLQFKKVLHYIEKGKEQGATLATGGVRIGNKGFFVKPTVFTHVGQDFCVAREEIFGPVLVVLKFKDFDEAIAMANDSEFGLAAAIWTKDMSRAHAFTTRVKAGVVWTNTYNVVKYNAPFGGVKGTGFGRDLGKDALFEYLNVKTLVSRV
jgi:aldehyde dehydrogenase (NAD+)